MTNEAADILRKAKEHMRFRSLAEALRLACPDKKLRAKCQRLILRSVRKSPVINEVISIQSRREVLNRAIALAEAGQ